MINLISLLPIISLVWYLNFLRNNNLNTILSTLIFLSFFMFATNYTHYGLEVDIYRYLHRLIGIILSLVVIFYVLKNRINFFKEQSILILVLFQFTLLVSYFGNDLYIDYYFHYVRNFIFIALIVSYLYFKVDSNLKIEELFKFIFSLTIILSLMIVYEIATISDNFFDWEHRALLFYSNPNYLAYALMVGLVISVFSDYKYRWLTSSLIVFSIFATGSRSVELTVLVIFTFFLFYKRINKFYMISCFTGALAVIYLALFSSFPIVSEVIKKSTIDRVRLATLQLSLNMIEESPINGIGYGQFRIKWVDYFDADVYTLDVPSLVLMWKTHDKSITNEEISVLGGYRKMEIMTHNDFLTVLTELGIIGIAFIIYVFYQLYFQLKRLLFHDRKYFYISLSLITSSLTFSMFHNNLSSFIFWFILFIPFIINRNYKKLIKS